VHGAAIDVNQVKTFVISCHYSHLSILSSLLHRGLIPTKPSKVILSPGSLDKSQLCPPSPLRRNSNLVSPRPTASGLAFIAIFVVKKGKAVRIFSFHDGKRKPSNSALTECLIADALDAFGPCMSRRVSFLRLTSTRSRGE